jgi:hypothetical protein
MPPRLAHLLKGVFLTFCPRLASNSDPPNIPLLSSCASGQETVPSQEVAFTSLFICCFNHEKIILSTALFFWQYWHLNSGSHAC